MTQYIACTAHIVGIKQYYNMIVLHFGPCVTFWTCLCDISARLVWHFGPLVRNEVKRVSPYPHMNHWRRLWEIPPIIGIKNNLTTIQQFHRVIADSCYCVRIILTAFKHFDMKGSRYRVTSTASLDDGIVRQQFLVVKGATWRNNGSSTRNGSRFDLDDRHLSGEYEHPWGEIKNVML